jgi:hypothetical protein
MSELQAALRVHGVDFDKLARESFANIDKIVVEWAILNDVSMQHAALIYRLGFIDGAAKYHAIGTGEDASDEKKLA